MAALIVAADAPAPGVELRRHVRAAADVFAQTVLDEHGSLGVGERSLAQTQQQAVGSGE